MIAQPPKSSRGGRQRVEFRRDTSDSLPGVGVNRDDTEIEQPWGFSDTI